ncbi:MAG: hypothetical protein Q4F09_04515 [Erysipelotrichaceae bacterium]|nr:hypothetical protein [Erysipelotrichaceae bacterium]
MIRNKYLAFALFVLFYTIFWNLMLWVFNQSTFAFTVPGNVIVPLATAIVLGYLFYLRKK